MKRWFVFLLLCVGCSSTDKLAVSSDGELDQTVTIALSKEPGSLDPHHDLTLSEAFLVRMLSEGLTRISPEGSPEPALAEDIEVAENGKTYIFKLRQAEWSNGVAVTSEDFLHSWRETLTTSSSRVANPLFIIENASDVHQGNVSLEELGVYAPDLKTIIVTLEHPDLFFLEQLAAPVFFPVPSKHGEAKLGDLVRSSAYLGCGPFLISSWNSGESLNLTKNPTYWDADSVHLQTITCVTKNTETSSLELFQRGDLDWAGFPFGTLPKESLSELDRNEQLHSQALAGTYLYLFNMQSDLVSNRAIRRALTFSIDRDAIITSILHANEVPAISVVPSTLRDIPSVFFGDDDTDRAKTLFRQGLSELDIRRSELPTFVIRIQEEGVHREIAAAIKEQWRETFRIKVEVVVKGASDHEPNQEEGAIVMEQVTVLADLPDPIRMLQFYDQRTSNSWKNPEYDSLLERARDALDLSKRTRLSNSAEKFLMEHMPLAPIFHPVANYVKAETLQGVYLMEATAEVDFKWAYRGER